MMTLKDVAKGYGFTMKYLKILVELGVIQKIPTDENMVYLSHQQHIWKNTKCTKESLRQIRSKARREKLVMELELTKPERYVLNRYLNAKGRLSLRRVASEVSSYYGVPENVAKGIVRKMRNRAYTAKCRRAMGKVSQACQKGEGGL
jgi:hypothetical protein